ncbi:MAG: hypothetical protein IH852_10690 [Bacteroidetes bacterium]|nr:hypothetical protein [Bacteroidota bacterium]
MIKKPKSDNELLIEINSKLNTLVALSAIQGKERDDKIKILSGLEFTNVEISKLLGIPKGTIDGVRAKKKGGKK